jgi:site-specific DNA recombinase
MSKRAAIYARVSTDEQTKGYSLSTQVEACRVYASNRGYSVVKEFCDDYSGAALDRPALNDLRELIGKDSIEAVIVYDVDRLARKSIYQMLIEEEFRKAGVIIEYVIGQYDDSDEGRLQKQIRAAIAEYEKTKILERSKRGKRGKAKSGYVLVGARPPYGYRVRSEPHKAWLEIDEEEARIVQLVYQWYLYGDGRNGPISMLSIAAQLTEMGIPSRGDKYEHVAKKRPHAVWSGGMIKHILTNEAYIGVWHYGKTRMVSDGKEHTRRQKPKCGLGKQMARPREEWIEVPVPSLVSTEDFLKVKERMVKNKEQSQRNIKRQYLMSRRLRCGNCGYTYTGRTRKERNQYYRCKGREQKPYPLCDMPTYRVDVIDNAVWEWVKGLLQDPENIMDGLQGMQDETRRTHKVLYDRLDLIQEQLDDALRQQEKLVDLYLSGDFDKGMLLERKHRLETTISSLRKEQEQLSAHIGTLNYTDQDLVIIEQFCAQIRENLDHATFEGKRRILDLLDVHGTLAVENDERVLYLTCAIYPQPVSLVLTSPSQCRQPQYSIELTTRAVLTALKFPPVKHICLGN